MTKVVIGNKEESTKKQKKATRDKAGKFFKGGHSCLLWRSEKQLEKRRKFFKGKNSFLRSPEKQKRCHNSKEATFDLERVQFLIMKEELNLEIIPHGPTC